MPDSLKKISLLIYDDNDDDLFTMKRYISSQHEEYEIHTVNAEGLFFKKIGETRFDLLLLDNGLGDLNGVEFMKDLLKEGFDTPIIVITGQDSEEIAKNVMEMGAYDYVVKQSHWFSLNLKLGFFKKQFYIENELRHLNLKMETEIENRTKEFRIAKEMAEKANRAKSVFLSNMSHELRTPMHAILSFSDFGLKKINTAPKEKLIKYFSTIKESGERLLSLLNNIIVISKLEADDLKLRMGQHDVHNLALSVINGFKVKALKKNIHMDLESTYQPCLVEMDREKIGQVFIHLIENAIEYSFDGGSVKISIKQIKQDQDEVVQISMSDEGLGIPQEELSNVFEKFEQSSKTKTGAGGTGLGLSICREIIRMHGGSIWAEGNATQGTVLVFNIPRKQNETQDA